MSNQTPIAADRLSTDQRRVLSVIHTNTNPKQGQWVSTQQVKLTLAAYGPLRPDEVEDTLDELEDAGWIASGESGYQKAPGVGRPKHPGEK